MCRTEKNGWNVEKYENDKMMSPFMCFMEFYNHYALFQITQERLGGKYGQCGDNDQYTDYYDNMFTYTLDVSYAWYFQSKKKK